MSTNLDNIRTHFGKPRPGREQEQDNEAIPYPYLCLGRLRENQFNICLIQPVMAFRVCFLVLHSRNADLQGYKLHITCSGIFQVCLYPGQPDIPCANTVAVGNAAQKFADNFFRDKIIVIWSTVFE